MQRHCRELGLPRAIAQPAAHLAAARVFDTRTAPLEAGDALSDSDDRVEVLQKAPVMLAIVVMCKHALKVVELKQVRKRIGPA